MMNDFLKNKQLQFRIIFICMLSIGLYFTYPVWKEDHRKQVVDVSGKITKMYTTRYKEIDDITRTSYKVVLDVGSTHTINQKSWDNFRNCKNCTINIYKDVYTRTNFGIFVCALHLIFSLALFILLIEMTFKYFLIVFLFFPWAMNHSNEMSFKEFLKK